LTRFDQKTKKQRKQEEKASEVKIQLVPYERFSHEALIAIKTLLQKMQSDLDIIKERVTFEVKKPKE